MSIQGYNTNQVNVDNNNGRGIIVYTSVKIEVNDIVPATQTEEVIILELKLSKRTNLILVALYRSPNSPNDNNLKISELMEEIDKIPDPHLILGDFNLPSIKWKKGCFS